MKKMLSLVLAAALLAGVGCLGAVPASALEPAEQLLEDVSGTYDELFPVICASEYDELWLDDCEAIVGEDMAGMCAEMLKSACVGTVYGEEAVETYAEDPESAQFDCFFIHDVSQFVFDGSTISGLDAEGNTLFSHEYAYAQDLSIAGMMDGYLYETADEDAGEFRYFFLLPDTPDSTYHIEFRYGSDIDALTEYAEGPYAYWLAAGIPADRDEELIENVIALFVEENLAEMGDETAEEVIEISSAEDLAAINDNLSGNYVLTADIDLDGIEWTPIGTYVPSGESEEEMEIPDPEFAFTGSFDGGGYSISNLVIDQPDGFALGLFGCIANAQIGNFTLENASVDGTVMTADVVGYAFCSVVSDVYLWNSKVTAHASELSGEGMYGGIVGAGMGSLIQDSSAEADIVIPDGTANAGILGGGLEVTSVVNSVAFGTVTAGDNCYGLGGVSGCGFGTEEFTGCRAEDVTITAGDNCFWIGGITGYAGGYEDEDAGIPVTVLTDCKVVNLTVETGENADGVDDIVGSGFYSEEVAEMMGAPYDAPTVFELVNCTVDGE